VVQRAATADEVRKVAEVSPPWLSELLLASLEIKRMPTDLVELKVQRVFFDKGYAILPDETQSGRQIDDPMIPLTPAFAEMCREAIGDRKDGWVFGKKTGGRHDWAHVSRLFRVGRGKAGLPDEVVMSGYGGNALRAQKKARGDGANDLGRP
jgi:hypothetical protein